MATTAPPVSVSVLRRPLLDGVLVRRLEHRLLPRDAALTHHDLKILVEGLHPVLLAGLDGGVHLGDLVLADEVLGLGELAVVMLVPALGGETREEMDFVVAPFEDFSIAQDFCDAGAEGFFVDCGGFDMGDFRGWIFPPFGVLTPVLACWTLSASVNLGGGSTW